MSAALTMDVTSQVDLTSHAPAGFEHFFVTKWFI